MTSAKDRAASNPDQKSEAPAQKPGKDQELDAEIVRDLEIDERAADVRGGGCASSHQGVACLTD